MKKPWWKDREELVDMLIDITLVVIVVWVLYAGGTLIAFFVGRNV